jgi:hypothetical protein
MVLPTEVTSITDPLPTTWMKVQQDSVVEREREMLSGSSVMWFDAPELTTHSVSEDGVWSIIVLKELPSDCWSHEPCQGV